MTLYNELPEWLSLEEHHKKIAHHTMQAWFDEDPSRFQNFSLNMGPLLLDYSKNRLNSVTLQKLVQLAQGINLSKSIEELFNGSLINSTEKRPALHTALRDLKRAPIFLDGHNLTGEILKTLQNMEVFTQQVREGEWLGATGRPIQYIVNIGIGGSHLGPLMSTHALKEHAATTLDFFFLSSIDSHQLNALFKKIDPETTLFIVSSKSFTTLETLTNATTVKKWLEQRLGHNHISQHFVAVTAAKSKAITFGISENNIFDIWDWVGGRYSIWSAIGLPFALMLGMEKFLEFLDGAHQMDEHFRHAPLDKNMPVILGLIGIWYINFFRISNHAIVSYAQQLQHLHTYLQQLEMESNGKHITHEGNPVAYETGPVVFGEHGCDSQHAFHQLLHQGPRFIPVDFIVVGKHNAHYSDHHDMLIASALSQSQALMQGKSYAQVRAELISKGCSETEASFLAKHQTIPGNRPSNTLFIDELTPFSLGSLLALYEHKVFVQGVIWNINSFDQWGVELGKQLLPSILENMKEPFDQHAHDPSTKGLIEHYRKIKEMM